MNFEPGKFFIGLVDFFSILLPGALLTYFLQGKFGPLLLGMGYENLRENEGWIAFLFSSYLIGNFIFLLGSWLLDDLVYDRIRTATYAGIIKQLAKGDEMPSKFTRWLAKILIKKGSDQAVQKAAQVKEYYLKPLGAHDAINAFQWSKSMLTFKHPEALQGINRFEADSKFFRSLMVVLVFLIPWGFYIGQPALSFSSIPMMVLSFWRYVDQRLKATNQAYWNIITLEASKEPKSDIQSPPFVVDGITHAGGIVYRKESKELKYLVVQAKLNAGEWVFPKGHIEIDESKEEAAVREVYEEAGVWARIVGKTDIHQYKTNSEDVKVQFYIMEALGEGKSAEDRKPVWLEYKDARNKLSFDDAKSLLKNVSEKLNLGGK